MCRCDEMRSTLAQRIYIQYAIFPTFTYHCSKIVAVSLCNLRQVQAILICSKGHIRFR
jgi:hypothetical protein